MNNTLLHTKNLTIGYTSKKGVVPIARDINISLLKGKLITLIGGNGIGKSTLLRTITAIQSPISGEVMLNNKNLFSIENSDLAQQQSLVLTDKLPSSNLTVWELIALGRQPYTNWIGNLTDEDYLKIPFKDFDLSSLKQFSANNINYNDSIYKAQLHTIRTDKIKLNKYNIEDYLPKNIIKQYSNLDI
jgi:ABC-type cobalamin/Fe3+-siderophores transport system ATPase subunit